MTLILRSCNWGNKVGILEKLEFELFRGFSDNNLWILNGNIAEVKTVVAFKKLFKNHPSFLKSMGEIFLYL